MKEYARKSNVSLEFSKIDILSMIRVPSHYAFIRWNFPAYTLSTKYRDALCTIKRQRGILFIDPRVFREKYK